jgi:hypothetical protein
LPVQNSNTLVKTTGVAVDYRNRIAKLAPIAAVGPAMGQQANIRARNAIETAISPVRCQPLVDNVRP